MNNLPLLRFRQHSKFAHPLAGLVYDNKKYEQSCFFEGRNKSFSEESTQVLHGKSKSTPYSLSKILNQGEKKKDTDSEAFLRTAKIFNISKRLSSPVKQRCSRGRWVSVTQTLASRDELNSQSLSSVPKLEGEIISQPIQAHKFKYPEIEVMILDTLGPGKQQLKKVKIQLKRYFESFFKDTLLGLMFYDLSEFVERYIDKAVQNEEFNTIKEDNNEMPVFNSKKSLFDKLCQCERLGKMEELDQLIRIYCLPKHELRQIYLQDVLNLLGLQLYEQFGLNKDNQYVLMTHSGKIIQDFAEIKFSTVKLYAANKLNANEYYQKYLDFVKYKRLFKSNNAFRETLKQNFRQQLVSGNFDDSVPPESNLSPGESRNNVTQAQGIINFKNDKTGYGRVRLIQYLHRRNMQKKTKQASRSTQKAEMKVQKQKYSFSMQEKIHLQFKKLKRICDYGDSAFKNDETCRSKILIGVLIKESVYFRTKSQSQVDRILYALEFISQGETSERYISKAITDDQYMVMRKIINCNGEKDSIVHFVDCYLNYDEYGQLQKTDLRETLAFIIGEQRKTCEIILTTIWCWLQKNQVIINQALRRNHMQLLFQRNKIVYYFIISLIFGTNDTNALQLAHQVLT